MNITIKKIILLIILTTNYSDDLIFNIPHRTIQTHTLEKIKIVANSSILISIISILIIKKTIKTKSYTTKTYIILSTYILSKYTWYILNWITTKNSSSLLETNIIITNTLWAILSTLSILISITILTLHTYHSKKINNLVYQIIVLLILITSITTNEIQHSIHIISTSWITIICTNTIKNFEIIEISWKGKHIWFSIIY
uniref:Uncharacterized protein n=1 Tax=Tabachnickia sp. DVL-2014 TaxID=1569960 RepID=A0A0N7AFU0_9METZ|nr:hypothetical protein [Tabachnickia sp. DVL-2014]